MIANGRLEFTSASLRDVIGSIAATSEGTSRVRIVDENGKVLLDWGAAIDTMSVSAASTVTFAGEGLGHVQVQKGAKYLIGYVLLFALLGCTIASISYIGTTKLPVQALEEAGRRLGEHRARLIEKNAHLDATLSNMVQGICMFDADQKVVIANDRYAELYGLDKDLLKPGTALRDILEARARAGVYGAKGAEMVEQGLAKFRDAVSEVLSLPDGRHISVVRKPLPDGGVISAHEDISDRRRADAKIAHMAMHDTLTGLPNRALFSDRLEWAIGSIEGEMRVAVHCLDLDRFKAVNDTLGHPMGDALLCAAARRLHGCVRGSDLVARLGGDEFAVLQTGVADPAEAAALAARLIEVLSEPFEIRGHRIVIGASVGIAMAPGDGASGEILLKNADLALYSSKSEGRGRFRFFEVEMDARIQARRALELDLSSALALDQFELYYQPLVDLKTNEVVAMEALLRWNHPARGQVSPAQFIPITEEIGLIEQLGSWVLRRACQEAATWPGSVGVSVNLSPHQFKNGNLAFDVAAALAAANLPASRLELEITESALMLNTESTLRTLMQIRDLGVRIAMDDFGTGYSSLSYLHSFPFDKIKIDKCFVQNLTEKKDSAHIFKAIVNLGANLRMVTTAEGVETQEQLAHLREEGCTQVQGYLISAPRPSGEIPELIAKLQHHPVAA